MGLTSKFIASPRRWRRDRAERRTAAERRTLARSGDVALFELSSVDMTVTFFENRLVYRRRLGAKHGEVIYDEIRDVRIIDRSWGPKRATPSATFDESVELSKKMAITLYARRGPLTFDFRSETINTVEGALAVVVRGMRSTSRNITEDIDDGRDTSTSRADELIKLARLRDDGVLTPEEFEVEKARVLRS